MSQPQTGIHQSKAEQSLLGLLHQVCSLHGPAEVIGNVVGQELNGDYVLYYLSIYIKGSVNSLS